MIIKRLAALSLLALAAVAGPASAHGVDVSIGIGLPVYVDEYRPRVYVEEYRSPVRYYSYETYRAPAYRVYDYGPRYYDRGHRHDRYCRHDDRGYRDHGRGHGHDHDRGHGNNDWRRNNWRSKDDNRGGPNHWGGGGNDRGNGRGNSRWGDRD